MEKVEEFIGRISTVYVLIGAILAAAGFNSIGIIDLTAVFSQETLDAINQVAGAVFMFIGYLKSKVVVATEGVVQAMSAKSKGSFALNPLKFSL